MSTPKTIDPKRTLKSETVYAFHPRTKEFVGTATAMESPLEPGVFLLPAMTTTVVPPTVPAGQVTVWTGQQWQLQQDLRGKVAYSTADAAAQTITALGALPQGLTLTAPATPRDKWNGSAWLSPATEFDSWNGKKWVTDTKAQSAAQLSELRARRNLLLSQSDWTQGSDSPLPVKVREAWADYRQALRDLPKSTKDPSAVTWPIPPS